MIYDKILNNLPKFTKEQRSGFKYWMAHYIAYNVKAMQLKTWKPKYLLHDIEKPWLKLLWGDYKRVQQYHRKHNKHHIQYPKLNDIDWEAVVIDWECSRYTKIAAPLTARQEMESYKDKPNYKWICDNMLPILNKLNI